MAGLRLLSAVTSLGNRVPVSSVIRSVGAKRKERGAVVADEIKKPCNKAATETHCGSSGITIKGKLNWLSPPFAGL